MTGVLGDGDVVVGVEEEVGGVGYAHRIRRLTQPLLTNRQVCVPL